MARGRRPDYKLGALDKRDESRGQIGVAWVDPETGRISIKLNYLVVMPTHPDMVYTLFPNDDDADREIANQEFSEAYESENLNEPPGDDNSRGNRRR